jgi:hypothetical protein
VGGGKRVGIAHRPLSGTALGHRRGQTFVVHLNGQLQEPLELGREGTAEPGLLALLPAQRDRQTDDDALGAVLSGQLRDPRRLGRLDRGERPDERPGRI